MSGGIFANLTQNLKRKFSNERAGMSLHIGVNHLDKRCYPCEPPIEAFPDGWDGALESCEADANDLQKLAEGCGFQTRVLLTADATAENVRNEIRRATDTLKSGDIFLLTYAGHGGQVPDRSRDEKDDTLDETWCLYDRQFIDDELYALFARFAEGVRVLILSDSCHSGTVSRSGPRSGPLRPPRKSRTARCMPPESVRPIYMARKDEYEQIQKETPRVEPGDVKASIRLLAACKDQQEANSGPFNGFFTRAVLDAWNDGKFEGDYDAFFETVTRELDRATGDSETRAAGGPVDESLLQTPNHFLEGVINPEFDRQRPFTI